MCGMPQQSPTRSTDAGRARPDASMSLLTNVMDHSLDDGYAEAAARRRSGEAGLPRPLRAKLWLGGGLVLAALVVTLGAAQARHAAPVVAKERQELIDRVGSETKHADDLEHQVEGLRGDVGRRQQAALKQHGGDTGQLVSLLAGGTEVHGPGVKLVVDDAKDTETGGDGDPRQNEDFTASGRVRDHDLQRVVNGLWASGAEAVSVNGQRLTSLSAVRAAGDAILVDNRPLVPPYTVLAVGNGTELVAAFRRSADGAYLASLHSDFGIRTSLSVQDDVRLPAAPSLIVRTARPVPSGAAAGATAAASGTGKPAKTEKGTS
ncbi:DUF881 domain-containing protein [Streptomyces fuscigenes]|uniref:DUF881 domain-containing protein n=1 Tax=Streptomyces fuscigenes TaxID=1528880 RepID=UPI001F3319D8|nr:DUF881 domain-containing protein [Streptomyces fuscigenes]MCF3960819.1 DUF881 domain-containing protein [Streptomyces fuscigenes]